MKAPVIAMLLLMAAHTLVAGMSVIRLARYRELYPVKQLSPRVSIVVSLSMWMASVLMMIVVLVYPQPDKRIIEDNVFVCSLFYNFLREAAILGFHLRCLRICLAYHKSINYSLVMKIFRSEMMICLVASLFSLLLPIVQIIEKYAIKSDTLNEFFNFFS